jgi:hypothetical protein
MASLPPEEPKEQTLAPATDSPDHSFRYTHVFYISRDSIRHTEIKIHDITSSISAPYPSEAFKAATEEEGRARGNAEPQWIILGDGSRHIDSMRTGSTTASTMSDENLIVTWELSKQQYGKNIFTFPTGSEHSGHPVTMQKEKRWSTFDEVFVVESIQYFWRYDGHSRRKFTLWKVVGQDKQLVGRYKAKKWLNKSGVLLVNAGEVDCALAVMTMMAMLRKVRQRG